MEKGRQGKQGRRKGSWPHRYAIHATLSSALGFGFSLISLRSAPASVSALSPEISLHHSGRSYGDSWLTWRLPLPPK